jgi:glycosyltransferase involved in cell wall biosynthesis
MEKIISYMVPSFNHEAFVIELLESLKKDAADFGGAAEIVIFDDGSSDRSPALISEWKEKNENDLAIKFVRSEVNRGIPFALNRLIEMAGGEFVRLCGTDDVVIPGSTKRMIARFSSGGEQLLCVFGDATVIDERGETKHSSSISYHGASTARLADSGSLPYELISHWCVAGPSMVLRRSHYQNMRYDETLRIDDFDLMLSLLEKKHSVEFINEPVCLYRIHDTNTSKTRDAEKRIRNLVSFLQIVERYVERGILRKELLPLEHKTRAKLNFLRKNYFSCAKDLFLSKYFARRITTR